MLPHCARATSRQTLQCPLVPAKDREATADVFRLLSHLVAHSAHNTFTRLRKLLFICNFSLDKALTILLDSFAELGDHTSRYCAS